MRKEEKLTRVARRSLEAERSLPRSSTTNPAGGFGREEEVEVEVEVASPLKDLLLLFLFLFLLLFLSVVVVVGAAEEEGFLAARQRIGRRVGLLGIGNEAENG